MKTAHMVLPQEDGDNISLWRLDPPHGEHEEVMVQEHDGIVYVLSNLGEDLNILWCSNTVEVGALEALFRWQEYEIAADDFRVVISRPLPNGELDVHRYDEENFGLAILRWYDILGIGNRAASDALRTIADGIETL